jgi:hypothetical protein
VAALAIGWAAAAKSDFETRFDQIPFGVTMERALDMMQPDIPFSMNRVFLPAPHVRYEWTDEGERFFLTFEGGVLTKKNSCRSPA